MSSSRMTLQALPDALPAPLPREAAAALRVVLHESIAEATPLWDRLEQDPLNSLHHARAWCEAWMATNRTTLLLLEGRMGEVPVFLLPLALERRRGTRIARFIAGSHGNINTGLLSADCPALPRDYLVARLRQALTGRVDLLSLENMPLLWRGRISPFAALPHTENQNHAFQLPLFPSFEDTLKQLNAKRRRKKFRLQQRRLEEAGGFEIFTARTPEQSHALLVEFFRQKAERFRTQGLPDVFRDRPIQDFFHMLLDADPGLDGTYPLRLHGLRMKGQMDGTILAIAGLSRKADHVICQFGSIRDDVIPEASPGEFLFWHVIEEACQTGAALFDFGIGDQTYKRSWCTMETVQYDVLVPLTARGTLAAGVHRAAVRLKSAIKANRALYGTIQRLRRGSAAVPAPEKQTGDED